MESQKLNNHFFVSYAQPEKHPYSDILWSLRLGMPENELREAVFTSNAIECLVEYAKIGIGIFASFQQLSIIRNSGLRIILPEVHDTPVEWSYTYAKALKNDKEIKNLRDFLYDKIG